MVRVLAHDRVEVLVNGVRRSLVPVLADALLRRQDFDKLPELLRDDAPAHPDVAVERERFVLRRNEDAAQPGVDAVAEREVDDAIGPAKVHGRLGPLLGERIEPLARAAGQDDDKTVVEERRHDPISCGARRAPALRRPRSRATAGRTFRTHPARRRANSSLRSRSSRRQAAHDARGRRAS